MDKFEKFFQYILLLAMVFIVYLTFFANPKSEVIDFPTDKKVYHPGDRIVFSVDLCTKANKYDEVTFQLQKTTGPSGRDFLILGSFQSISEDGCFTVRDLNPKIPDDLFKYSEPGVWDLYIISHSVQNRIINPRIYKTQVEIR